MASLFKPPESVKRNPKSPKLTLPPMLKNKNLDGSQSSGITPVVPSAAASFDAPPSSSSGTSATTLTHQSYCNFNSSSSSSSPSTSVMQKKRPIPPPIPNLVLPKSAGATTPDSDKLVESLNGLQLQNGLESKPVSTRPYLNQELNSSTDSSYPSALLAAYDSNSSISSPLKSNALYLTKDVDELEEDMWQYVHLKDEIISLGVLGEGSGGSVAKCKLKNGTTIFALKTITTLNTDAETQKQIFRELQFNKNCKSEYIVRYYGMFNDDRNSSIYIAMEYMGGKSLDAIYKNLLRRGGRISEKVLGKIAESVLRGLSYLHERRIIHRDIKPQNILLNEIGQVKLCDFGVSGEAVNSLATTFTGTSYYMAPERIQGQPYSVTSDVWSLGLTLLEVAQGHFPFNSDKMAINMPPIELLMLILTFTPELKDEPEQNISWSKSFKSFIGYCLKKESRERPSPRQMLQHPWIQGQMKKKVNMEKFISRCWEED